MGEGLAATESGRRLAMAPRWSLATAVDRGDSLIWQSSAGRPAVSEGSNENVATPEARHSRFYQTRAKASPLVVARCLRNGSSYSITRLALIRLGLVEGPGDRRDEAQQARAREAGGYPMFSRVGQGA